MIPVGLLTLPLLDVVSPLGVIEYVFYLYLSRVFIVALAPQQSLHIGGLTCCLFIVFKILVISLGNIFSFTILVMTVCDG
jgi:hypothetical protein